MPTKLYYFKTKQQLLKWCRERKYSKRACEEAWTGPGYYYARSRKHISKHVEHLDKRRGGKVGKGPWRHIHDIGKIIRKLNKHVKTNVQKRAKAIVRKTRKKVGPRKATKLVLARTVKKAKKLPKEVRRIAEYLWDHIPRKLKEVSNRKWTFISTLALAKYIYNKSREKGVDWKQYDWVGEIDWREGYHYAKSVVNKLLGSTKEYSEIPESEIIRRLKELEEYGDVELEIELDPAKVWELQHIF